MTNYSVHREQPRAVRNDLLRIWAENLNVAGSAAGKYQWLYEDCPHAPEDVFVLRADGMAIGTLSTLIRHFQLDGRVVPIGLHADLAVDEHHRLLIPALRLVRAVREATAARCALSYGYPNKLAEGVFLRAGFRELGRATRYVRVLRHADYAKRLADIANVPRIVALAASVPALAELGGVIADVASVTRDMARISRALSAYRLEWLERADPRVDALWEAARSEYQVVGRRSSAFLQWRYPAGVPVRVAGLVRHRSRELAAYAIIEQDGRTAHIRDLFGHQGAFESLLALLGPALYAGGAGALSIRYLGSPAMVELLTRVGFRPRETQRMISIGLGAALSERQAALAAHADHWHLLDIDEDS